ncbi:universal stress protein [Lacinutrix sp. WUR7]|uniref:universal stress protein n=1 Tax=Lacinutrix sp. WUR7 TaxID=2653681 RepID=UPI00193EA371|nr:universal stress protein [Lacinutrix sp. WUR7]QRM89359.1 universal stress protein [Lacinutrix sp. WUR7]
MNNILLPTDFSDNSWNAITYALNFYENAACNFYLLHVNELSDIVVNDSSYDTSQETIQEVYSKPTKKKLVALLKKISEKIPHNNNHKLYTISDNNFFIESIREQVQEKKIDVIVMGTKGASGLKKYITGSNTGDVITKVKCTTLVVPENAKYNKIEEVAFPTDYSINYNLQTLLPLSKILDANSSNLRILHISNVDEKLNVSQQQNKELLADYFNNSKYSFHNLTNKKVENAIQCFIESRNIGLIAMVAKNLNYFQQILFHNKVENISYHTDIPFLVLHEI